MKRFWIAAGACALALTPIAAAQDKAPVIDPARLAAARATVDYVFPTGTYARIMNETMGMMMDKMMDSVGKMPLRDMAAASNLPRERLDKLGEGTLSEVMAIYDPHYQERAQRSMRAMSGEMVKLMTEFEPAIREGMTRAYARRFTATQLGELNRFFATPTGTVYAADSLAIFMDPEVMTKMMEVMPAIMQKMPSLMTKMQEATADLPPPRKLKDLTPGEKDRLATLLGVPADQLRDQKDGLLEMQ